MFGKKKEQERPARPASEGPMRESPGEIGPRTFTRPENLPAAGRPATEIPRRPPEYAAGLGRRSEGRVPETESKKLIVGKDIILTGEIRACDRLMVEGRVEASLEDCHSIEIAETGLFKGAAEIDVAEISGRFEGNLVARQRLSVRATGRVVGSVRYGELEVERGGVISGEVENLDGVSAAHPRERHEQAPEPSLAEQEDAATQLL
jgi:cytoskeletal protein CcmA (bactofilin family)